MSQVTFLREDIARASGRDTGGHEGRDQMSAGMDLTCAVPPRYDPFIRLYDSHSASAPFKGGSEELRKQQGGDDS